VFSILDNGTKQIPVVADGLFDLLMLKITPNYTSKKQTKVGRKDFSEEIVNLFFHSFLKPRNYV
jgi:hypothetical protein